MRRIIAVIIVVVFLAPFSCFGTPSKPSVSGFLSSGEIITISGSSFGTKSPAKPYLWAPFDGSLNPSTLGTRTSWDGNENMAYTSNEGAGGTGGAKATDDSGTWTLTVNSSGFNWNDYNQQIYMFRKKKYNFDPGTANWKVWRMWPTEWAQPDFYVGTNNGCVFTEGVMESCNWFEGSDFEGTINAFNSEQFIFKGNSNSSTEDGILRLIMDGVTVADFTDMKYKNDSRAMTRNFAVHGIGNTPNSSSRMWVDDVYVDITWARVMLGNASTLSACTHVEPQIPSAWNTTEITATVNTGTFAANDTAYLFVVDANGEVSPASAPLVVGSPSPGIPLGGRLSGSLSGGGVMR